MKTIKNIIVSLAIVAGLASSANSQTGSITGSVTDANGEVIHGANVTASNPTVGITRAVVSNEQGVFVFPQLPHGTYTVTVEKTGFKRIEIANVVLSAGDQINVGDLQVETGDVSATVQVEADSGQLLLKSESGSGPTWFQVGNSGILVSTVAIPSTWLELVPGVISGGLAGGVSALNIVGQFNINGTRSDQHEVTVDGVTNFNLGNNTAGLVTVNPDALEEVKILTSNYQAEYGRSGGGFIAMTTRSGTNEYHGSGRYFRLRDSMNANNYFNNARGPASTPRALYRYNYYGWDFGGPV